MAKSLNAFLDSIQSALKDELPVASARQGVIQSYKDGVIHIKGLPSLKMNEVVTVEGTDTKALVLNLEKDSAYAVVLQSGRGLKEGMFVNGNDENLQIPVGEGIIGRVVDPLGNVLDGRDTFAVDTYMAHEKIAPGVMERKSVDQPVQTGILAIDSMIPIGRGQRELIIGDRQTGKTAIAIDTILNQKGQDMICIYVSIAQRESKTAQVYETLKKHGALDYSIVVSAGASASAVMHYLAPFAGCAIAEYFMAKGKDVLVVYDDLSKHAVAYREMSLLLRRPPGREAYPGDVFYLHSRLLERAARLAPEYGGGSITALPIIETQANDVSAYIPTNVISITDGQIFLESDLFYKGIRPAMNVGISVSRVGGAAQTKIMKKVSGTAKLSLAQYYELEAFSQFASELDESTKAQLTRGRRVVEAMKQRENSPYKLWEEVAVTLAATEGHLDAFSVDECSGKIREFLSFVEHKYVSLTEEVMSTKAYSDDVKNGFNAALNEFFKN